MKRIEHECRARSIIEFYERHSQNRLDTLYHFRQQKVPDRTIRNVLKRYIEDGQVGFKQLPGQQPTVNTPRLQKKVLKKARQDRSKSDRVSSRELGLTLSTYRRVKKAAGIRSRKKRRSPKYNPGQIDRCIKGAAKLYKDSIPSGRNFFFVLDDETYVPLDPTQVAGDKYYLSDDEQETPVEDTLLPTGKFESRYMIWQAISEGGHISEPFVTNRTVNGEIYLKECIKKRLVPFIRKLNVQRPVLFWPDLATSHYVGAVLDELKKAGISIVPKRDNLPNVPQLRPIERFWALCKQRYCELNKPATNIASMKRIWTRISKQIATKSGKSLFKSFRSKLLKCAKQGPVGI